jgi:hypothetical protein
MRSPGSLATDYSPEKQAADECEKEAAQDHEEVKDSGSDPVGLDYWIWPGRACGLGSSLSDLLERLPARAQSARLPDGAGPA